MKEKGLETGMGYYLRFAVAGIALGGLSAAVFAFFGYPPEFFTISLILVIAPVVYGYYQQTQVVKKIEENFRVFLDDLRDLLQAGVDLTNAIEISAHNDYGPLKVFVQRLAAQVKIGVPFEKAMDRIFGAVPSSMTRRMVLVINQTLRAGGNFMKVFATSTDYVDKIERLNKQRQTATISIITNAYMMFFVFVVIVVGIQVMFLPLLENTPTFSLDILSGGAPTAGGEGGTEKQPVDFSQHFLRLLIVQAFFAGPIIGKISENSAMAGIRHSVILLLITVPMYLFALNFFGIGGGT